MDIRFAKSEDAEQISAIYAPVVLETHVSFEERPPNGDEMKERILAAHERYPWLVAEDREQVLGYSYASSHRSRPGYRWSVESSVFVHKDFRGRGIARALYEQLFVILTVQSFHNAYAGIALPNDASVALHRAAGFAQIGIFREVGYKLGAWRDTSWWQLALTDGRALPMEPLPLSEVRASLSR